MNTIIAAFVVLFISIIAMSAKVLIVKGSRFSLSHHAPAKKEENKRIKRTDKIDENTEHIS